MNKRMIAVAAGISVLLILAAAVILNNKSSNLTSSIKEPIILVNQSALDALSTKDGSTAVTKRLSSSILPPTNSWLSGMVLQEAPLPVYPMPNSFQARDTGFDIGLPVVSSTATVVWGTHTPGLTATIISAAAFQMTRHDKISATLTYYKNNNEAIGSLTIAQGSPYTFFRGSMESIITVPIGDLVGESNDSYIRFSRAGSDYIIFSSSNAKITVEAQTATISVPINGLVTFYTLGTSSEDLLKEYAGNEIQSVETSFYNSIDRSETVLNYRTVNNQETAIAAMAYAKVIDPGQSLVSYGSIYGTMQTHGGNTLKTSVPITVASNTLDISKLTEEQKLKLVDTLKVDIENTTISANDSYFAGKQLARAATLLDLSVQLNQPQSSIRLKSILREGFSIRLAPNYYYYDTRLKGISAQLPAFGSEDFNDHHFHYGYFIYAASILGRFDNEFLEQYRDQVNLLVADIASYSETEDFPINRTYDPYSSHSWAAGLAPFADGNNQESGSEALNAWNGVALWAELTSNEQLRQSAVWMLSNESETAKLAWRKVDTTNPRLSNYTSPIASLNFSGKRTYSTFFSDEPNAKLGIQLLPMSPVMLNFKSDGDSISSSVSQTIQNNNFNVSLGDYILMYNALAVPLESFRLLDTQNDTFIDDGNSRTYMSAWMYTLVQQM